MNSRWIGSWVLVGLIALLVACRDDAPTGPGDVAVDEATTVVTEEPAQPAAQAESGIAASPVPDRRQVIGVVVGPDDAPVEGAEIALFETQSPWPYSALRRIDAAYSGRDGQFRFFAPVGTDLVVEVVAHKLARKQVPVPVEIDRVSIRMEHGFQLIGYVFDKRGSQTLMRNCEVFLEPSYFEDTMARSTRTDDQGRFWFDNVAAGQRRVTARSELYQPVSAMFAVGSPRPIQLEFQHAGRSARGRVVDAANGRPIEGAEVRGFPGAWNGVLHAPITTVTDTAGSFELKGIGEANLTLEVHHPDYSVARRGISGASNRNPTEFELLRRVRLAGKLTGEDVEGVALRLSTDFGEWQRVVTDEFGGFAFDPVSHGFAEVEIEAGRLAFVESAGRYLTLNLEEDELDAALEVTQPAVIRGRVVDAGGRGIANVKVTTPRSISGVFRRVAGMSDSAGEFEIRGAAPGTSQLMFSHESYADAEVTARIGNAGEEVVVEDVTLVPDGRLTGFVMQGDQPAPGGVSVVAAQPRNAKTAVTDSDGRYVVRGLAPGSYRVKARYSTMPFVAHPESVTVVSGRSTEVPTLRLQPPRRVTGVVYSPSQHAVAGAFVFVPSTMSATYTDSAGKFELDVTRDIRELQIWSPDMRTHVSKRVLGRGALRVQLDTVPRWPVKARVLGLPTRRPLTRGVLRITADREDETWEPSVAEQRDIVAMVVEIPNGSLVAELPVGRSRIEVCCQGFAPYVADIDIPADLVHPLPLGEILLEPGATVRGRVVDEAGAPIPGAIAFLGREADLFQSGFQAEVRTDADGRFELQGVSPQNRNLIVAAEGRSNVVYQVRIPRDLLGDDGVVLMMQAESRIDVRVVDADGTPSETGIVRLRKDGVSVALDYVNADGRASFAAPSSGEYVVELLGGATESTVFVGAPDTYAVELQRVD